MRNIDYTKIGTIPEVECYRDSVEDLIAAYYAETDKLKKMAKGALIEMCAEHFYGITVMSTSSMADLIDTIRGMDQALEFQ